MAVTKFFKPSVHTGWHKNDPLKSRRSKVLRAHKGNYLSAARSMQALANVSQDPATARQAGLDARYFYRMNKGRK